MSQVGPGVAGLPLFGAVEERPAKPVHDRHQEEHAVFFERVRGLVAGRYGGHGIRVTTDEVWDTMERYGVKLPPGASPNILGSFFSAWDMAEPVEDLIDGERRQRMQKSKRRGANGNLLRVWTVKARRT